MQLYFYLDQTRCTGCETCVVACKDWNDVPAGPARWIRVTTIERGKYPDVFVTFLTTLCYHCVHPPCVSACPAGAITKRTTDGIVVVNTKQCLGKDNCDMCLQVCPYAAPQFGAEKNAKMQKCDFCIERWGQGKKPICVDGCPMRALDAGTEDELKAKYGDSREATGFVYWVETCPCVIFRPKLPEK